MPKVKQVKAAKDYPDFGIKKGELHYNWTLKTGPRSSREYRQKTPPKRGQLTTSEFLGTIYDIVDNQLRDVTDPGDVDGIIGEIENARDEMQSRLDGMPEGLQQGPTGQLLESRISQCDEFIASIESAKSDWESAIDGFDDDTSDEEKDAAKDAFISECEGAEPGWD